jgi:hypothetical protein
MKASLFKLLGLFLCLSPALATHVVAQDMLETLNALDEALPKGDVNRVAVILDQINVTNPSYGTTAYVAALEAANASGNFRMLKTILVHALDSKSLWAEDYISSRWASAGLANVEASISQARVAGGCRAALEKFGITLDSFRKLIDPEVRQQLLDQLQNLPVTPLMDTNFAPSLSPNGGFTVSSGKSTTASAEEEARARLRLVFALAVTIALALGFRYLRRK